MIWSAPRSMAASLEGEATRSAMSWSAAQAWGTTSGRSVSRSRCARKAWSRAMRGECEAGSERARRGSMRAVLCFAPRMPVKG